MSTTASKHSNRAGRGFWPTVIRQVEAPLGLYVLTLLIVEATLGGVLMLYRFSAQELGRGVLLTIVIAMISLFLLVLAVVTTMSVRCPENLLFNARQWLDKRRRNDLEPSALRDSINTLIGEKLIALGLMSDKPPMPRDRQGKTGP